MQFYKFVAKGIVHVTLIFVHLTKTTLFIRSKWTVIDLEYRVRQMPHFVCLMQGQHRNNIPPHNLKFTREDHN